MYSKTTEEEAFDSVIKNKDLNYKENSFRRLLLQLADSLAERLMENVAFTELVNCHHHGLSPIPSVLTAVSEDAHAVNFLGAVLDRGVMCTGVLPQSSSVGGWKCTAI